MQMPLAWGAELRWITLLILVCLQVPFIATAAEVRVGIDSNPPLTSITQDGQAEGLLPDLLRQVARQSDWTLTIVPCQWQQCLAMLDSGQIDMLPAIAYTEERAEKYNFAEQTVFTSWGQVYQRADDDSSIDSILQLDNKKLAVLGKDVYYVSEQGLLQVAATFDININYVEVTSYAEAFEKLANGDVDAAMVGRIFGIKKRQQYGLRPAPILIKPIQVRPAFAQTAQPELKEQFDRALSDWKAANNSVYYRLLEKWLGEKLSPKLPDWLRLLMYSLAAILCLLLLTTIWTRKQVKLKTLELAEKNRLLEDELIERQTVEAELRERQQQYQVLFEENQEIILLIDPQTTEIVDANPAACNFYQYPRKTLQGMSIADLNELNPQQIQEKLQQIESRELKLFELPHHLASGETRPVEIHCSPIVVGGRSLLCSIIRDISKRKKAEKALAERNDFLQSVIDGVSDPLMVIDFDYQVLQMNEAASDQLTPTQAEQESLCCYQISHAAATPCNGSDHPCPIKEVQETGQPVTVIHNHLINERLRIVELNASPLYNAEGQLYAVIEVARDITERQQVEELLSENEKRLRHLAHHDYLTDLPNRLLFEDRLKQALSKARRSRKQVALFFLDLDHFKDINDNLGHDFGDLLLVDIAKRLTNSVRESDTVARMGGDEFLILLEEVDSIEMIEQMAERICEALSHELSRDNYRQKVSASVGISIYPDDGSSGQELLKAADQAMYRAKDKGKATYQFASAPQGFFDFDS
jgi:diguanylate cyclase (GGDEF)-like protein/PAS domain S-box-containing protein